jgi:hypothetical protein
MMGGKPDKAARIALSNAIGLALMQGHDISLENGLLVVLKRVYAIVESHLPHWGRRDSKSIRPRTPSIATIIEADRIERLGNPLLHTCLHEG